MDQGPPLHLNVCQWADPSAALSLRAAGVIHRHTTPRRPMCSRLMAGLATSCCPCVVHWANHRRAKLWHTCVRCLYPPPYQDSVESGRLILRDGTTALIRLAQPDDREALRTFFEQLSPESRQRRFFSPVDPGRQMDRYLV